MFDVQKATQIAAYFIWRRGGRMSYLKLMKLMYLAEREFILKYGERLTGDRLISMRHGPVLSETYDLFKVGCQSSEWDKWIAGDKNFELSFKKMDQVNPSDPLDLFDCLSNAEVEIFDQIYEKYGHLTRWQLRDLTHTKECCPEWSDPEDSVIPISIKAILTMHGKTEEESDSILEHIREMDNVQASLKALS